MTGFTFDGVSDPDADIGTIAAARLIVQAASLWAEGSMSASVAALGATMPAYSLPVLFGFWVNALVTVAGVTNTPFPDLLQNIGLHIAQVESGIEEL